MTFHRVKAALVLTSLIGLLLGLAPVSVRAQSSPVKTIGALDVDSTAVRDILRMLATRNNLNVIMSSAVQGRSVSIHLRDTPVEEALNLVVRAAGLGYERVGNTILVMDAENLSSATTLVTRVIDLQYANAADVRSALLVLCKDVTANVAGNQLVIRASPSVVDQAVEVVKSLDRKPAQVLLEARLIEVNTSRTLELGIDWAKITNWNGALTEGRSDETPTGTIPSSRGFIPLSERGRVYRQLQTLQVTLDALITDGAARLLSNAKVVTIDGTEAEIFSGESVPVVVSSLSSSGGNGGVMQTVQLQKVDVGVKLNITPRVSEDSLITVLVRPEVAQIQGYVGPNSDLPKTATRRASSLVRVRDGEKIYLGGFLKEEKSTITKKVPLLGQIPWIGNIFRHHRNDRSMLDLVIEVTPRIVGDQGGSVPMAPKPVEETR